MNDLNRRKQELLTKIAEGEQTLHETEQEVFLMKKREQFRIKKLKEEARAMINNL